MGSEEFYEEERPVREETVASFWIDEYPVTVAEYHERTTNRGVPLLRPLTSQNSVEEVLTLVAHDRDAAPVSLAERRS